MRLDLSDLVSVLLVLAALAVALPKRDWRSIPARFRETTSGQRHYLFGPPDLTGTLSSDLRVKTLQLLRAELRRGFELGIPVLLAAWFAEAHGVEARREREAAWRESKPGLLFKQLAGEMTEEELHRRLRERGYPLAASKLVLPQPRTFTMPPMRWRLEWEQHLKELEAEADRRWAEDAAPTEATVPPQTSVAAMTAPETGIEPAAGDQSELLMELRTLGEIRIVIDGKDVAPELMHRPASAFTVLYLLSREVLQPGDRVTRDIFGEETFRGQDPQARRKGVSQRLANLKRESSRLRSRIRTDGEYLSFDSAGCDIDVHWVFRVAEDVKAAGGILTTALYGNAQRALSLATREFLPGWEGIESRGTLGGSGVADVISDVRDRVVAARLDILSALADAALARQQLDDAISYLEEALRLRPERTTLARKLADVYERNGQPQRAARLRGEYGLDEAS